MISHAGLTRLFFALVASLLTACGGGNDGSGPPPLPTPPAPAAGTVGDGRITELIEWARSAQGVPAMGVIVIRSGQVAERGVVGMRSADGGPAVTTEDSWHLGSITKSMTATLAAVLVEDGVITWDTTPLEVWPELTNDIHSGFRNITLRQLLSHTSGMKR
jgi:CubicO group peptidase (beta-lactamase class C family)